LTYLNCSVYDCAHNYNFFCCLSDIKIEGHRAKAPHETCCASFEKAGDAMTNSVRFEQPDPDTEVACAAENCRYNADGLCAASHITVNGSISCNDSDETECTSFHR